MLDLGSSCAHLSAASETSTARQNRNVGATKRTTQDELLLINGVVVSHCYRGGFIRCDVIYCWHDVMRFTISKTGSSEVGVEKKLPPWMDNSSK